MPTIQELGKKSKGAPVGNVNKESAYCIKSAIHWALAQEYDAIKRGFALKEIAKRAVADALAGDKAAREWIADRTEGKATQTTTIQGDAERPLNINVTFK